MMTALPYRSWVEISRTRLRENFHRVRAAVGPEVEVMPVVKADAYGHGAVEVSRLLEREGARWLAVSSVAEGVALRRAKVRARILVMADFLPAERAKLKRNGLTPVIHSLDDLAALDRLARSSAAPLPFHLKVDSGMGRLGTREPAGEILAAVSRARHTRLEGLMTHFASAADYSSPQTDEQTGSFNELCSRLRAGGIRPDLVHTASTNAIAYGRREAWHNMVRAGHAIYGYLSPARGPAPPRVLSVEPVLTWKAAVISVKDLPEGARVGYGGMFRTARPTRIAVIAAGYADGLSHRLSNKGMVIAAGRLAPILGAVSMDVTTIDVTDCPSIRPGDAVTLLGREGEASVDAQQMARMAGTISYDILCGISARVKRVYV